MGTMEGRVALVTGAARGQGRAHAIRLAREGADIIAIDICTDIKKVRYPMGSSDELAETVRAIEELGRRVLSYEVDARDSAKVRDAVADGVGQLGGRLDTTIINHGINLAHTIEDADAIEVWDLVTAVNYTSFWYVAAAAVPYMKDNGGAIIMTGSAASLIGVYGNAAYTSAKHGLIGMVKSLALDLSHYSIRVNAVCPGTVPTMLTLNEMSLEVFFPGNPDATYDDMKPALSALNPLPVPWVEVDEVTEAVLFLVSDAARSITGVALPIDAGFTIQQPGMNPKLGRQFWELSQELEEAKANAR
jgi:SDR family mycofactocin-dependent oxidoreductase